MWQLGCQRIDHTRDTRRLESNILLICRAADLQWPRFYTSRQSHTKEHPSLVPACHQVPERRPPGKMRWQLQLNSSLCPPNNLPPEPANLRCVQSCRSPITPSPTPKPPPPQQPARRLLCTNHKFYHRERLKNDRRGIKTSTSKRRRRSTAMPTISSSNPLKMSRQPFHN
jgi:hypothetical protein